MHNYAACVNTARFPQHSYDLSRFNGQKLGKPYKQFFVWAVPLPNTWIVLREHLENVSTGFYDFVGSH